ncbi:MAG TPA: Mut7-C RNAse domain-containing protein [Candidatus Cloacimonadota bacterium]|nr:Mut7-C RNAse domain-containing protein [Candidatus Cloacimonadota bacterium]
MNRPRFLLTENLNKLARFLRMLGYDAVVYKSISSQKMIDLASKERRILLTRSHKTAKSKIHFSRILIKSVMPAKQLQEIASYLEIEDNYLFTRCLNCNKHLFEIEKQKISDLVPDPVFQSFDEFTVCRSCGKIYWKGTHYTDMKKQLAEILE